MVWAVDMEERERKARTRKTKATRMSSEGDRKGMGQQGINKR